MSLRNALAALLGSNRRTGHAADAEPLATRLGLGDRTGVRTPGQADYLLGAAAQPWKLGINKTGSSIPANSLVRFDGVDATSGLPKLAALSAASQNSQPVGVTLYAIANNAQGRYLDFAPAHIIRVPSGVSAGDRVAPYNTGSSWISSAADATGCLIVKAILGAAGDDQYAVAAWCPPQGVEINWYKLSDISPAVKGYALTNMGAGGPGSWSASKTDLVHVGTGCIKVDDIVLCYRSFTYWSFTSVYARLKGTS